LCQQYSECGCDDNGNSTYLDSLVKDTNGDGIPDNTTNYFVGSVNGTRGIYIDGTLPNGTTAPDPNLSFAATARFGSLTGYLLMASLVVASVTLL
jgi:hypothetical protein